MRGVDFGVGERSFRVAVGEGVGHALLAWGHILAPKYVEKVGGFQVCRFGLLDHLEDGFVCGIR
jgi:hypothetical protein